MNKQIGLNAAAQLVQSGMTIGIGGWGPRRKPMALVRAVLDSDVRDLTVVAYGGPEVGMLAAAGKIRKLVFAFVSMDPIPLEPYFRKAREAGALEVSELDEGMLQWGLRAAGMRLPFLPTRVGLGTDILTYNPDFKTITSPYDDGEVLIAMPAIKLDLALLHVDTADRLGNTHIHGPDPFFDALFARAAQRTIVSCEEIHDRLDLARPDDANANQFERYLVSHVVHAPEGAHPTSCAPRYGWDLAHLKRYAASATEEGGWARYCQEFLSGDEASYQSAVGGAARIGALPLPVF
jgi:glutaconate CoA-transferase subunit A